MTESTARAPYATHPGERLPPGATPGAEGVNFSLLSPSATAVELLLYESADSPQPLQVVTLDPDRNHTHLVWHVFVVGVAPGVHYAWRVTGPDDTATTGRRFNPRKLLLDPWGRGVGDAGWSRARAADPVDESPCGLRSVVCDPSFDWKSDRPLPGTLEGAVIYEMHVGGFTRHPSAAVAAAPGTFAALMEKIPYLKALGITHVELLPIMAFDEQSVPPGTAARGLRNYWGYNTHSFYSLHPAYCGSAPPGRQPAEFKRLVRSLHEAGIRVILDVVFNHTAEGPADGPWINFKGIANEIVYHLDPRDRRRYLDFTGCGNTVNCNHPQMTAFIVHCLEYWVEEVHVDGFRFDLASVFARGDEGVVLANPPLPWNIELSRTLADVPLIAEAWDAAGLYQLGAFPGSSWSEWNGSYRDTMRRFIRGDAGLLGAVARRISGSSDLYERSGRRPCNSINFVTCHDGFTLADLVSYERKHNEANGDENRDGTDDNLSANCGAEGPTSDATIIALRRRQARNFLTVLMLSRGVPMLRAGDEVLASQAGNNNAYCQDNALSWFDWKRVETEREMLRFTRELIAFRRRHPSLTVNRFYTGANIPRRGLPDISWHGARVDQPDWNGPGGGVLAFTVGAIAPEEPDIYAVLNMSGSDLDAEIPAIPGRRWHLAVDTAAGAPGDIAAPGAQRILDAAVQRVSARSVVVLEARPY